MTTNTFARTLADLERLRHEDCAAIGAAGRTLALVRSQRTRRSALLFHGLAASPMQFERVARELFERGYNVLVPRLPRHGYADRMTTILAGLTAGELFAAAANGLAIARGLGEEVTVSGFSMGGTLTAWVAQNEDVARAAPLMPFLAPIGVPAAAAPTLSALALRLPNAFAWWDPILRERQMPAHGYPRYATHAVAQLCLLAQEVLDASKTQAPRAKEIVVVNNRREAAVSNRAIARLVRRWRERRDDVETFAFADLPVSHDIIEPLRAPWVLERVYPRLLELLSP